MGAAVEDRPVQAAEAVEVTTENSPMYALGRADAWADNERVKNGNDPVGKQPPYPRYRTMYDRGYDDHFAPVPPDKKRAEEEA